MMGHRIWASASGLCASFQVRGASYLGPRICGPLGDVPGPKSVVRDIWAQGSKPQLLGDVSSHKPSDLLTMPGTTIHHHHHHHHCHHHCRHQHDRYEKPPVLIWFKYIVGRSIIDCRTFAYTFWSELNCAVIFPRPAFGRVLYSIGPYYCFVATVFLNSP